MELILSKIADTSVFLIFPPLWTNVDREVDFPTLGIPMLVGALRGKGIRTLHFDLNLEFRDHLLASVETGLPAGSRCDKQVRHLLLPRLIKSWLAAWRTRAPVNGSGEFHDLSLSELVECSADDIGPVVRDATNPFHDFYLRQSSLWCELDAAPSGIVGISVLGPTQVIPALTLAYQLRQHCPHLRIMIGGPWPTLHGEQFANYPELMDLVDALVIGEGENTVCALAHAVQDPETWSNVPGCIVRRNGFLTAPLHVRLPDLDQLSPPDFSDLDLQRYQSASTVTYQMSRGCYWGHCVFCEHTHGCHASAYRQRPMERVLDDLAHLVSTGRIEKIVFTDAGLAPSRFRLLAQGIIDRRLRFDWWCFARPEQAFTESDFALAAQAGCRAIHFGIETVTPRLAALMRRGTHLDYSGRLFEYCAQHSIETIVGAIVRFPTEQESEAQATLDYLRHHQAVISKATVNLFNLQRSSEIHRNALSYGLIPVITRGEAFRSALRYRSVQSLTESRAREMVAQYLTDVSPVSNAHQDLLPRISGPDEPEAIMRIDVSSVSLTLGGISSDTQPIAAVESGARSRFFVVGRDDAAILHLLGSGGHRNQQRLRAAARDFGISVPQMEDLLRSRTHEYAAYGMIANAESIFTTI